MDTITFKPVYLPENKGLGNALSEALANCTHELVARMDSDDISAHNRFELQLRTFLLHPDVDIIGGNITEFVGTPDNIVAKRVVPRTNTSIKQEMKRRCAMNHVSVMYKKDCVREAGGYLDWPSNEDYFLWVQMLERGCTFKNIPFNLVNVRIGEDMSARRGGWKYFRHEQALQKYMLDHKMISLPRYLQNVAVRFGGEFMAPNWLRGKLFKFMRKPYHPPNNVATRNEAVNRKRKKAAYPPFSVAMAVYGKDNVEWFDIALNSIIDQTVKPDEIVLVVDGPVPRAIQGVIDKYAQICRFGDVTEGNTIA